MKRLAYIFVTALLLGLTGYLSYAYGNVKGREEAMEELNAKRIFPGMYKTLEEEHNALTEKQWEALYIIDQYDSFVWAFGKNEFLEMGRHLANINMIRNENHRDTIKD